MPRNAFLVVVVVVIVALGLFSDVATSQDVKMVTFTSSRKSVLGDLASTPLESLRVGEPFGILLEFASPKEYIFFDTMLNITFDGPVALAAPWKIHITPGDDWTHEDIFGSGDIPYVGTFGASPSSGTPWPGDTVNPPTYDEEGDTIITNDLDMVIHFGTVRSPSSPPPRPNKPYTAWSVLLQSTLQSTWINNTDPISKLSVDFSFTLHSLYGETMNRDDREPLFRSSRTRFSLFDPQIEGCPSLGTCLTGMYVNNNSSASQDDDPFGEEYCVQIPTEGPCEMDDFCVESAICVDGECVIETMRDCDDGNPCTRDECSSSERKCLHYARGYANSVYPTDPTYLEDESNHLCPGEDSCVTSACSDVGCLRVEVQKCTNYPNFSPQCATRTCVVTDPSNPLQAHCTLAPLPHPVEGIPCSYSLENEGGVFLGVCSSDLVCVDPPILALKKTRGVGDEEICDDGIFCNGLEYRNSSGLCSIVPDSVPSCDDFDACTTDYCSSETDRCEHIPFVPSACNVGGGVGGACKIGQTTCDSVSGAISCVQTIQPTPLLPSDATLESIQEACALNQDMDCDGKQDPHCAALHPCLSDSDCLWIEGLADQTHSLDCVVGTCNSTSHLCQISFLNGVSCDDSNPCTLGATCSSGICSAALSSATPCSNLNPCMDSICMPTSVNTYLCELVPTPGAPCQSGNPTAQSEHCNSQGVCQGVPQSCVDGSICTQDFVSPVDGQCVHLPLTGLGCNDLNPCTLDECSSDGQCVGTPRIPPISTNPCTEFICDPLSLDEEFDGVPLFRERNRTDGTLCSISVDSGCSSREGMCVSGSCVELPAPEVECPAINELIESPECVWTECNPVNGKCQKVFADQSQTCQDLRGGCYTGGVCVNGTGLCVGTPMDCSNSPLITEPQCQRAVCDPIMQECRLILLSGSCDDGDECTKSDTCIPSQGGICKGTPISCDNGKFCDGLETCVDGTCQVLPENMPNCSDHDDDDQDLCAVRFCDEYTQSCQSRPHSYVGQECGLTDQGICSLGTYQCDPLTGLAVCQGAVMPMSVDSCSDDSMVDLSLKFPRSCPCADSHIDPYNGSGGTILGALPLGNAFMYNALSRYGFGCTNHNCLIEGRAGIFPVNSDNGQMRIGGTDFLGALDVGNLAVYKAIMDASDAYTLAWTLPCANVHIGQLPFQQNTVYLPGVYCFYGHENSTHLNPNRTNSYCHTNETLFTGPSSPSIPMGPLDLTFPEVMDAVTDLIPAMISLFGSPPDMNLVVEYFGDVLAVGGNTAATTTTNDDNDDESVPGPQSNSSPINPSREWDPVALPPMTIEEVALTALYNPLTIFRGTITLDAQGDPDAVWIFRMDSKFVMNDDMDLQLINGAKRSNVFWISSHEVLLRSDVSPIEGTVLTPEQISFFLQPQIVHHHARLISFNDYIFLNEDITLYSISEEPTAPHYIQCNDASQTTIFDSDCDGVPDCLDGCPLDPNKQEPGHCGCFEIEHQGCFLNGSSLNMGNGLDDNCNGIVDEGCGILCLEPDDCPTLNCHDVICSSENKCVYFDRDGTCSDRVPCGGIREGVCRSGVCVHEPRRTDCLATYEPSQNGGWDKQCVRAWCYDSHLVNGTIDPAGDECRFEPLEDGTECDDGDACTLRDVCVSGMCQSSSRVQCDDSKTCTTDSCNPVSGECEFVPRTGPCQTGNPCLLNGRCDTVSLECVPSDVYSCDDGNECSQGECIPVDGLPVCVFGPRPHVPIIPSSNVNGSSTPLFPSFVPIPCHTGRTPCSPSGFCVPGTTHCHLSTKDCDSFHHPNIDPVDLPCHFFQCDDLTGECRDELLSGVPCDDNRLCTENDQCVVGQCVGTMKVVDQSAYDGDCVMQVCYEEPSTQEYPLDMFHMDGDDSPLTPPHNSVVLPNGMILREFAAGEPHLIFLGSQCGLNDGCTRSHCVAGNCRVVHEVDCQDDSYCNGQEFCVHGECLPGQPIVCRDLDQNPCTVPTCSESLRSCVEVPLPSIGTMCGNSTVGACSMGIIECHPQFLIPNGSPVPELSCVGAVYPSPEVCDDFGIDENCNGVANEGCGTYCFESAEECPNVACNRAVCNAQNLCEYIPVDQMTCDDGLFCTTNTRCLAGSCISDPFPSIDPLNPCIAQSCDEETHTITRFNVTQGAGNCTDGSLCTQMDTCNGLGACVGIPIICNDRNASTIDMCDPLSGLCVFLPDPEAGQDDDDSNKVNCDDSNECTEDFFSIELHQCVHVPVSRLVHENGTDLGPMPCNNGNLCLQDSYCSCDGECIDGTPVVVPFINQCIRGSCNPLTGSIDYQVLVGHSCTNVDLCEYNSTCTADAQCVGEYKNCSDSNPCTDDYCDEETGICQHVATCGEPCDGPDGFKCACVDGGVCECEPYDCSDGIYCNGLEIWSGGRCVPGTPIECPCATTCSLPGRCSEEEKRCVQPPLPEIGKPCGHPTNGTCKAGEMKCDPIHGLYCYGYVGPEERDLCDGLDRDCDGYVDTHCAVRCTCADDCVQSPQNPCLIPVCLANQTCSQMNAPCGASCEPQERDPCAASYGCDQGICKPTSWVECTLPVDQHPEYDPQCVVSSCCSQSSSVEDPCQLSFLNGEQCEYGPGRIGGHCAEGICIPTPICCDDHNECTEDSFNPEMNPPCQNIPRVGEECSIKNPCITQATCSAEGQCVGISRDLLHVDEGGCLDDVLNPCSESYCVASRGPNRPRKHSSNEKRGGEGEDDHPIHRDWKCIRKFQPNGKSCPTSDSCMLNGRCQHGSCVGTPKNCTDHNICTTDRCVSSSDDCGDGEEGQCVHEPNNLPCPNRDKCTRNSFCKDGTCSGIPVECKFDRKKYPHLDEQCVQMDCDPLRGCVMSYPHGACNDRNSCTTHDRCNQGVCEGIPMVCDNGDPCDGVEYCHKGECKPGKPVQCDDSNRCTVDYCDKSDGKCRHDPLSEIGSPCGPASAFRGECRPGIYECGRDCGLICKGGKKPQPERCGPFGLGDGLDQDCDGVIDNGCGILCGCDRDCHPDTLALHLNESVSESFLKFARGKISLCAQNGTCVYIDPECSITGRRHTDIKEGGQKSWRVPSSKCQNGWWDQVEVHGQTRYECQCKFGWTGPTCNECNISPAGEPEYVYRCAKDTDGHRERRIRSVFRRIAGETDNQQPRRSHDDDDDRDPRNRHHDGTSLVDVHGRSLYRLVKVLKSDLRFYDDHHDDHDDSTRDTISSLDDDDDDNDTRDGLFSSMDWTSVFSSLSFSFGSSRPQRSGILFDDDDDGFVSEMSSLFSFLPSPFSSSSSSSSDGDETSLSQSSVECADDQSGCHGEVQPVDGVQQQYDRFFGGLPWGNHPQPQSPALPNRVKTPPSSSSSRGKPRRSGSSHHPKLIVPGTNGLSCTCEIQGELSIYEKEPLARCEIEQVDIHQHHDRRWGGGGRRPIQDRRGRNDDDDDGGNRTKDAHLPATRIRDDDDDFDTDRRDGGFWSRERGLSLFTDMDSTSSSPLGLVISLLGVCLFVILCCLCGCACWGYFRFNQSRGNSRFGPSSRGSNKANKKPSGIQPPMVSSGQGSTLTNRNPAGSSNGIIFDMSNINM